MFQANLYGIMGLATIAMCWAFAVVLYRVGAPGGVARSRRRIAWEPAVFAGLDRGDRIADRFAGDTMPECQIDARAGLDELRVGRQGPS